MTRGRNQLMSSFLNKVRSWGSREVPAKNAQLVSPWKGMAREILAEASASDLDVCCARAVRTCNRRSALALAFADMVETIALMRLFGQVSLLLLFCLALEAQEKRNFEFESPVVRASIFKEVGMTEREKDNYASNLAIFTGNEIVRQKANADSLAFARKALALALHLSARNKRAVILNFQLDKGVMPKTIETQYSPKTLATLFVTRAEVLYQQNGEVNKLLARCLIDLAVTMDPRNEDAVYAFEMQKIDLGEVDWRPITDAPKPEIPNP